MTFFARYISIVLSLVLAFFLFSSCVSEQMKKCDLMHKGMEETPKYNGGVTYDKVYLASPERKEKILNYQKYLKTYELADDVIKSMGLPDDYFLYTGKDLHGWPPWYDCLGYIYQYFLEITPRVVKTDEGEHTAYDAKVLLIFFDSQFRVFRIEKQGWDSF